MRRIVLAVVIACCAGACSSGGGGDASSSSTTTSAPPGATAAGASADPTCNGFRGATRSLSSTGERPAALLTAAQAEAVGCLDRVAFTFQSLGNGLPPGYSVSYQDLEKEPLKDGDTQLSPPPGSAYLVVVITPAASTDTSDPAHPVQTYKGNLRLSYGDVHHLDSVVKQPDVTDDKGVTSVRWVIGLDSMRPFLVDSAMNPTRVSIYIG
ncbi:MAG: hypothetical protein ABW211_04750 [Acidimicrobiia bacterium]